MNEQELLKRITATPEIFGGKPIVRGMRICIMDLRGLSKVSDEDVFYLRELGLDAPSTTFAQASNTSCRATSPIRSAWGSSAARTAGTW